MEKHGVNGELRQKGKIAELALGYGGSVGALTAMGAIEMGLFEDELQPLVDSWRNANPNIVQFWWAVDRCVKKTIRERMETETHGIRFYYKSGMLFHRNSKHGRCRCTIDVSIILKNLTSPIFLCQIRKHSCFNGRKVSNHKFHFLSWYKCCTNQL